ncbi:hypothetical protein DRO53_03100 [Candidatus Bathyarchaeota archaeon]|nr:MAG: hypothetical protein DRO46_00900 [Candidatus Hecatellales archaeon]RLI34646.1 MAG: hypothetical protein DRO53_03100 [Candidatus Bathyarchaeota archaeon]
MSWEEEAITFTGSIRRSGSSYVVTIPVELFHRFLLKEGQSLKIFGMVRRSPEFQGMIGVFLGAFRVVEKHYGIEARIGGVESLVEEAEKPARSLPVVEALAEKYNATGLSFSLSKDGKAKVKMVFGSITPQSIIKPKSRREVEKIKEELIAEVEAAGGIVEEAKIFEEETEWYTVDPSLIAKSPYKNSENLRWEWKV